MTPPNNPSSVYLDTNALVTVLMARDGYELVVDVLERARQRKLIAYISPLSYVEVRGYSNLEEYPPDRDKAALNLLDSASLIQVEFSRRVALTARKIAHQFRLYNHDAVHVASAVEAGADVLLTSDKQLVSRGRIKGVYLAEPYEIGVATLFGPGSV